MLDILCISAHVRSLWRALHNEKPIKVRLDQKGKVSEQEVMMVAMVADLHGSQS